MATTEEMSLARKVLQLGMSITAQGKINMHVEYSAHVDMIAVWDDNGLAGWTCNDHTVYLGDFHNTMWSSGKSRVGAEQLEALIKEMDKLLEKDADGIPL
jgi:hypothetical protein